MHEPMFETGDRVWAGVDTVLIYLAGQWWPTPLPGTVVGYRLCETPGEWFYSITVVGIELVCVFPEHDLRPVSVLDRMAEASDW